MSHGYTPRFPHGGRATEIVAWRWRSDGAQGWPPCLAPMDPDDPEDAAVLAAAKAEAEATAEQLFAQFDADGSGSLDTVEVRDPPRRHFAALL